MPETTNNIYAALAAAQAKFRTPLRTKTAAYGKYADLQQCLNAVRPALNEQGIYLYQTVETDDQGWIVVETVLTHSSGMTLSSGKLRMPVGVAGKQNSAAQMFGSAETYARRYSLSAFLGIAADDDDDGQNAGRESTERKPPALTDEQKEMFRRAADEGRETFREFFKTRPTAEKAAFNADQSIIEECRARCEAATNKEKTNEQ